MGKSSFSSIPELALQLGITRDAVYKKVRRGELKAAKVGRNFAAGADENKYISIPQLATMLGISRIAVYKRVKSGSIKAVKVGRNHLIERAYANELGKGVVEEKPEAVSPTQQAAVKRSVEEQNVHLSIPQLASQMGLTRDAVYKKVRRGKIRANKIGRNFGVAVNKDEYLSLAECAAFLGLSRIAVYKKVKKGQLPAKRIGRSYAVLREDLGGE